MHGEGAVSENATWASGEEQSGNCKSMATRREHTGYVGGTRKPAWQEGSDSSGGWEEMGVQVLWSLWEAWLSLLSKTGSHWRALNRERPDTTWGLIGPSCLLGWKSLLGPKVEAGRGRRGQIHQYRERWWTRVNTAEMVSCLILCTFWRQI